MEKNSTRISKLRTYFVFPVPNFNKILEKRIWRAYLFTYLLNILIYFNLISNKNAELLIRVFILKEINAAAKLQDPVKRKANHCQLKPIYRHC